MLIGQGLYGLPEPELPKKPPSKWRWPLRITLFFLVVGCIGLVMLSRMGGNSDGLKDMTEEIISGFVGLNAEINQLNAVSFFPVVGVDFSDATLSNDQEETVATADHVNFSTGFWSGVFKVKEIRTLNVKNIVLKEGGVVPRELVLRSIGINPGEGDQGPRVEIRGSYGGETVYADINLRRDQTITGFLRYVFDETNFFSIRLGPVEIDAEIKKSPPRKTTIVFKKIIIDGISKNISGQVTFSDVAEGLGVDLDLDYGQSEFSCQCILSLENGIYKLEGKMSIRQAESGDVFGDQGVYAAVQKIRSFWYGAAAMKDINSRPYRLLNFETGVNLHFTGIDALALDIPVVLKEGKIPESTITGMAPGGPVSGTYTLDTTGEDAVLDIIMKNPQGIDKKIHSAGKTMDAHARNISSALRSHLEGR